MTGKIWTTQPCRMLHLRQPDCASGTEIPGSHVDVFSLILGSADENERQSSGRSDQYVSSKRRCRRGIVTKCCLARA